MTVTIHRDCRPTLDLRTCRRECWIDSEEIVATSSDRRVDACCLHCTPSARKQGQQDTRALCIHRIRSHSIESLFVTSSSLSWRHLYFIAYINISDGWHMQNKCWFFIKCIYEFLIIASPSLSANYAPPLLLVNTAAVSLYPLYRGRPPTGHHYPHQHHEALPAARRPRHRLYIRPRRCGRWGVVSDVISATNYCLDPLQSLAAPKSLFAASEARLGTLATAQQEVARRGARCRPRSRVSQCSY